METICIIPARGGSKGIPGKNIMNFCGKPLLAWSILQARQATSVTDVYVTSDDDQILKVAAEYGAKLIKRPVELATDVATSEAALLHALNEIESKTSTSVNTIVFLQATSPLRTPEDITGAVDKFYMQRADSLFSAVLLEDFLLWGEQNGNLHSITYDYRNRGRRQDRNPCYLENGSIYVSKGAILREEKNRLGGRIEIFYMPFWKSFEIDSIEDIALCEYLMRSKILNVSDNCA